MSESKVDELLKKCVQCGSCILTCPVYRVIKEEAFSPRGKLYYLKLKKAFPEKFDEALNNDYANAIFTCAICGRCVEICSSEVQLTEIFKEQRKDSINLYPKISQIKSNISNEKNLFGLDNDLRVETWLMDLLIDFPNIEERIYKEGKTADLIFFIGCLMSFRSRQTRVLKSILKILDYLGENYLILGGSEFCCGHPLDLLGKVNEADEIRENNSNIIHKTGAKIILTDCPGCLEALINHHKINSSIKILHLTEYLDSKIKSVPNKLNLKLKYHDPCELFRNDKVTKSPRSLLKKMGIEIIEMEPSCCGGGGLLRVANEAIAQEIINQRISTEKLKEEPFNVITCCPSCLEQFEQNGITTWDIAEYLVKALNLEGEKSG